MTEMLYLFKMEKINFLKDERNLKSINKNLKKQHQCESKNVSKNNIYDVPPQGIEPWIFGLRDRRLTTWPQRLDITREKDSVYNR